MDKKKLQEFLAKLQEMASELNNATENSAESDQTDKNNKSSVSSMQTFADIDVATMSLSSTLQSIIISQAPDKTTYNNGDYFDSTGMIVTAVYSNGQKNPIVDYEIVQNYALVSTDKYVTIKYQGKTVNQPIEVISDHENYGVYFTDISGEKVSITAINGHAPVYDGDNIEVEIPGIIDFAVDMDAGDFSQVNNSVLCLAGRVRSATMRPSGVILAANSNKYICDFGSLSTLYGIPLKKIYDETGSANFRLALGNIAQYSYKNSQESMQNYPHEIFSVQHSFITNDYGQPERLEIRKPANKVRYLVGQKFETAGMQVYCTYSLGATVEITNYTVEDGDRQLTLADTSVTIKYGNLTVEHQIVVEGQSINITRQTYKRTMTAGSWGEWKQSSNIRDGVFVQRSDSIEYKTVLSFNKAQINLGNKKKCGLRLYLRRKTYYNIHGMHIKVNGIEFALPDVEDRVYLYIGNINAGESGTMRVEFEYADCNIEFYDETEYIINTCDALDPTMQSEKKQYNLAGGASLTLDLFQGSNTLTINDISADSTLLGIGLTHVYNPMTVKDRTFGCGFRVNIFERLEMSDNINNLTQIPVYTDGAGNKYTFNAVFYIIQNNERGYLTEEAMAEVERNSSGQLYYSGYQVYVDYIKLGNYRYLTQINDTIADNTRYKQLLAQNDKATLPVRWIKADNLYKGFNESGRLVLMLDEFGHYTDVIYTQYGELIKIQNNNGNYIEFEYYSAGNIYHLQKVKDSRGRRIEYEYSTDQYLTSITYYDSLTGGSSYKSLQFDYTPVTIDGLNTYAVSKIESSDNTISQLTYEQYSQFISRLKSITHCSYAPGATAVAGAEEEVSSLRFDYNYESYITDITDQDNNSEKYCFDIDGVLKEYYQIINYNVAKAELYSYTPYEKKTVTKIGNEYLNSCSYGTFKSEYIQFKLDNDIRSGKFECTVTDLNEYNMPVKTTQSDVPVTDSVRKDIVTEYEYDEDLKTTKEISTQTYSGGKSYKYETSYTYDPSTALLTKKVQDIYRKSGSSFVKEQTITEEYEYDSYGCVEQTKLTRTGTVSTGANTFFTQKKYNSYKQAIREYDETGNYYSTIAYKSGTNLVSKVTAPHSNIINYSYDDEDRVVKMWGTSQGKENANTSEYSDGEISTLNHSGNNALNYTYDAKRRPVKITLDGTEYETYEYEDDVMMFGSVYDIATVTNAKSEEFRAEAEIFGREERAYYNNAIILERKYNTRGELIFERDRLSGKSRQYQYDLYGNLKNCTSGNNTETYSYDSKGQLSKVVYTGDISRTDSYAYAGKAVDYITKITTGNFTILPEQDIDERYTGKTVKIGTRTVDEESVTYIKEDDHATHMPGGITYPDTSFSYTYDGNGNIKKIMQSGVLYAQYEYDTLGRLIREDNKAFNKSYFYTYDNNGNIIAKESCAFTTGAHTVGTGDVTSYTYSKDKMTKFGNQTCVYDSVGNPTTYRGKTAVWVRGRKLASFDGNTFEYNAQGIRIKKNGITYIYDSQGRLLKQSNGLEFFYDANGLVGLKYNGLNYVYRTDIQCNVIAILDSDGDVVVEYKYDAWGNQFATGNSTLASINPFRYRSYYFDTETGLYYLQTRYYDPETGRFLNIDSLDYADPETINGLNLYAYCGNNPVMNTDPEGHFWFTFLTTIIGAVVGAVVGIVDYAVNNDGDFNLNEMGKMAAAGAASGATSGFILGITKGTGIKAASYASAAVYSATTEIWDYADGSKELNANNVGNSILKVIGDTGINGTFNYLANFGASKMVPTNPGWFIPKKFISYFTKSYGQKMMAQTALSGGISNAINIFWKMLKEIG